MPTTQRDSIIDRFQQHRRIRPAAPAYFEKIGRAWVPTSWQEYTLSLIHISTPMIMPCGP